MKKDLIGIAIGGTKTAVTFARFDNGTLNIIEKVLFPSFPNDDQKTIEAIFKIIDEKNYHIDFISIISGGPLDIKKGTIDNPPHLPGFKGTKIVEIFKDKYHCEASLLNDADACALAEYYYGAGQGSTNMAFCTFGTGFGAGLVLNNKLYTGHNGMAGEVGHVQISDDGPIGYGVKGSVEGWCAGGNIFQWAHIDGAMNTKELFDLARQGNGKALEAINLVADKLGKSLSILVDTLNLDTIVVGGIYPRNLDLLEKPVLEAVGKYSLSVNRKACKILPSYLQEKIDDYSSLMGFMKGLAMKNLFEKYPELVPLKGNIDLAISALVDCYKNNGKILVCGNGGSAADASHIVGELMKGFMSKRPFDEKTLEKLSKEFASEDTAHKFQMGIPCIDLGAQAGLLTAFANDVDPDLIFAQEVLAYSGHNPHDVLIGLSTSGNSKNVVNAFLAAKAINIKTIAFTGSKNSKMSGLASITLQVPAEETYLIQEYHLPIYHYICQQVEKALFDK